MTNQSPFARRRPVLPSIPRGDILGTYDTYLEAQGVVDRLSKADFDVAKLSIVGNDLKTVERVTGKLTWARAAIAGAASGAWLGLFFGMVFFIFSTSPSVGVVAAAALIGAGFGVIFGLVTYGIQRGRRDFTSTHQVLASNYTIIIDPELTAKAQQTLQQHPAA